MTGKFGLAYYATMANVFDALSSAARRALLDELCERDEQTLFELCTRLAMKHGMGLTRQAISQHLELLEAVGLVKSRREGRYKFHSIDTRPLRAISAHWKRRDEGEGKPSEPPVVIACDPANSRGGRRESDTLASQ